jgi:hypothetical protein
MQFLHVLTPKTLLKNPMQFTGISHVSCRCHSGSGLVLVWGRPQVEVLR